MCEFDTGKSKKRQKKVQSTASDAKWLHDPNSVSEINSSSSSWLRPLCLQPVRELRVSVTTPEYKRRRRRRWWVVGAGYIAFDLC